MIAPSFGPIDLRNVVQPEPETYKILTRPKIPSVQYAGARASRSMSVSQIGCLEHPANGR